MATYYAVTVVCVIYICVHKTAAVAHETTLLWTQKNFDGTVRITGIPGEPAVWIAQQRVRMIGTSSPLNKLHRLQSHRVALAFRYAAQELYFSDIGFRQLFKVRLRVMPPGMYSYNATLEPVYRGTSVKVFGMAVDWLAGSVYWTDARYNWITVAATDRLNVFRHLITTGLDKPMGIAVHPVRGFLFWTDWGAVPKIERSDLEGRHRRVIVSRGLGRPLGITVDYHSGQLFWVDDQLDTIERSDFDGRNRKTFNVGNATGNNHYLFGIAVYKEFIFVTDQYTLNVLVYNKTDTSFLRLFGMVAIPYDIMMYDASLQQDIPNNECATLGCEDICLSQGGGGGRCVCRQGSRLQADGKSCLARTLSYKPQYIYTVGSAVCRMPINAPDRIGEKLALNADCFINDVGNVQAMAFDSYADLLFYSDARFGTIHRKRMGDGGRTDVIAKQAGNVKGMAVDWLSGNLYWTDEEFGKIAVATTDGSYHRILRSDIHSPKGIAVNPLSGLMYWSARGAIYVGQMDGTNAKVLVAGDKSFSPDGLVIDITKQRLIWVAGDKVESVFLNGSHRTVDVTISNYTFRDVTVYQDYISWTDGANGVYFGHYHPNNQLYRHLVHPEANVSHDVIAYSTYLQPLGKGKCDVYSGSCSQLCVPTPSQAMCVCAVGFHLASDQKTCISSLETSQFVLLVDPFLKEVYQVDTLASRARLNGVGISDAQVPTHVDFDPRSGLVYWFDAGDANVVKRAPLLEASSARIVMTLPAGTKLGNMVVDGNASRLFYTDPQNIHAISLADDAPQTYHSTRLVHSCLSLDQRNRRLYWVERSSQPVVRYHVMSSPIDDVDGFLRPTRVFTTHTVIKGITVDITAVGDLYWWTKRSISRWDPTTNTSVPALAADAPANNYTAVAVAGDSLFYGTWGRRTLSRYNVRTGDHISMTTSVFYSITDVRVFGGHRAVTTGPTTATTTATTHAPAGAARKTAGAALTGRELKIVALTVAGSLVVLVLIFVVVFFALRRRRKHAQSTPAAASFVSPAHDNPVYMSAADMQRACAAASVTSASGPLDEGAVGSAPPLEQKVALSDDAEFGATPSDETMVKTVFVRDDGEPRRNGARDVNDTSDKALLVTGPSRNDGGESAAPTVNSLKSAFENVSFRNEAAH